MFAHQVRLGPFQLRCYTRSKSQGVLAVRKIYKTLDPSCDICGTQMAEHKCKITCPHCDYTRDCSDP